MVEDSRADAELLIEALSERPELAIQFVHVEYARDAIARLRQEAFDVALLDLSLPDSSGLSCLESLHELQPSLPVIILTGRMDDQLGVNAVQLGADDYLTKGHADGNQILHAIRYAIERHRRTDGLTTELGTNADTTTQTTVIVNDWPSTVAGCRLIRVIGRGNSAYVFQGERNHPQSGAEKYAVKILVPNKKGLDVAEIEERFLREAEIMSEIRHPNIVEVFEFGRDGAKGMPYILMELIEGTALNEFIGNRKRLGWKKKLHLLRKLAMAVREIHRHGICHRDIKPNNILVTADHNLKLIDFGIAKVPESHLTLGSEIMGTPVYMAPEAFDSTHGVDHRADIFSLGILTYELLLGQRPFEGDTIPSLAEEIRNGLPLEPRKLHPALPLSVQQILATMLKKQPDSRYHSVDALVRDLDAVLEHRDAPLEHHHLWSFTNLFSKDWS